MFLPRPPHHRAGGSVPGGSPRIGKRDPEILERDQTLLTRPLIGHRELRGIRPRQMPRSVRPAPRRDGLPLPYSQLQQVTDPRPASSPLYPKAHADTAPKPWIDLRYRPVVLADPEIPHPTSKVVRQLRQAGPHRNTPADHDTCTQVLADQAQEPLVGHASPETVRCVTR